jgi:hypothetical protein
MDATALNITDSSVTEPHFWSSSQEFVYLSRICMAVGCPVLRARKEAHLIHSVLGFVLNLLQRIIVSGTCECSSSKSVIVKSFVNVECRRVAQRA